MESDIDQEAVNLYMKKLGEERFEKLKVHMKEVAQQFKDRHNYHKERSVQPLTPTKTTLDLLEAEVEQKRKDKILVLEDFSVEDPYKDFGAAKKFFVKYCMLPQAIHPQGSLMLYLLGLQTVAFLYNAWAIPLRFCFHIYQNDETISYWLMLDYTADLVYFIDTTVFKTRMMFLDPSGIYSSDPHEMLKNFLTSSDFLTDALSLLPLDLGYLLFGLNGRATLLRFPRLFRARYFGLFFDRLDAALPYPVFVRLSRTVNVMLYMIHITACAFYAFSDFEGIDSSPFVFNGHGHAYIRCFYVGLKTSVSIGINPKPGKENPLQMVFMGSLWLMGVFVFAVLIGNVKDIIAQSTRNQDEYMFKFDQISQYMYAMNVPEDTRKRVKEWCQYTWKTQKSFDELAILEHLPVKMRTDVALDIHYQTLKEVKLFHGCDPGLIKELVVKLQPIIFLSGDYICKKGDVGKEMFIITVGQVQVVGGPDDSIVFVTLGQGVCFGEIALLGSGKMNRRTANVRALGYTTLYVLFKDDLNEALTDYPEDRELLARKAQKAAAEVNAKQRTKKPEVETYQRDVIFKPYGDPALLTLLLQFMPRRARLRVAEAERKQEESRKNRVFKDLSEEIG